MPIQPSSTSADLQDILTSEDTDPRRLTARQLRELAYWADQEEELLEDAPLSMLLGVYHATQQANCYYFSSWLDRDQKQAAACYNRFARANGMTPIYGG